MNRTYNMFVDNGLFVLSYYTGIPVNNITYEIIENTLDEMCERVVEFTECEKYSNLKHMCFSNSVLTQKTKITLSQQMRLFLDNKGKEYCEKCGESHANVINEIGRSYFPNTTAHTFYNFSNNLVGLNICPYCLILTMYSMLNARVSGGAVLYMSDDDEFMADYTEVMQSENIDDIKNKAAKSKDRLDYTKILEELFKGKLYYGYIEQLVFNNSGQSQKIDARTITRKSMNLINEIKNEELFSEFISYGFLVDALYDRLKTVYNKKLIVNGEIVCSKELYEIMNKELNGVSDEIRDLAIRIARDLSGINSNNIINKLKLAGNLDGFERFLIYAKEEYYMIAGKELFTSDEYMQLDDIKIFRQIKNMMIIHLM